MTGIKVCNYCKREYHCFKDTQKYCSVECYRSSRFGKKYPRKSKIVNDYTLINKESDVESKIYSVLKDSLLENIQKSEEFYLKFLDITEKAYEVQEKYPVKYLEFTLYSKSEMTQHIELTNKSIRTFIYDLSKESPTNYVGGTPRSLMNYFDCTIQEAMIIYSILFIECWNQILSKKVKFLLLTKYKKYLKQYSINYSRICVRCGSHFKSRFIKQKRCQNCVNYLKNAEGELNLKNVKKHSKKVKKTLHPCERCGKPISLKFDFCYDCGLIFQHQQRMQEEYGVYKNE